MKIPGRVGAMPVSTFMLIGSSKYCVGGESWDEREQR